MMMIVVLVVVVWVVHCFLLLLWDAFFFLLYYFYYFFFYSYYFFHYSSRSSFPPLSSVMIDHKIINIKNNESNYELDMYSMEHMRENIEIISELRYKIIYTRIIEILTKIYQYSSEHHPV